MMALLYFNFKTEITENIMPKILYLTYKIKILYLKKNTESLNKVEHNSSFCDYSNFCFFKTK